MRKKPKLEEETSKDVSPSTPSQQSFQSSSAGPSPQYDPRLTQPPPLLEPFNQFNNQAMWQQPPPATGPDNANISRQLDYANVSQLCTILFYFNTSSRWPMQQTMRLIVRGWTLRSAYQANPHTRELHRPICKTPPTL